MKGFPFGKGSFVKVIGFPYGKGSLQIKGVCLWKRLVVKESPFGEGSLQSYVFMEKALCKEISLWKTALCKEISLLTRLLVKVKEVSFWKGVIAKGLPY